MANLTLAGGLTRPCLQQVMLRSPARQRLGSTNKRAATVTVKTGDKCYAKVRKPRSDMPLPTNNKHDHWGIAGLFQKKEKNPMREPTDELYSLLVYDTPSSRCAPASMLPTLPPLSCVSNSILTPSSFNLVSVGDLTPPSTAPCHHCRSEAKEWNSRVRSLIDELVEAGGVYNERCMGGKWQVRKALSSHTVLYFQTKAYCHLREILI
eukprot:9466505-Pyramimonas_sp.AAC.1